MNLFDDKKNLVIYLGFLLVILLFLVYQPQSSLVGKDINIYASQRHKLEEERIPLVIQATTKIPEQLQAGLILIAASGNEEVVLINHQAQVLHRWSVDAERAKFDSQCNLAVIVGSRWAEEQKKWSSLKNLFFKLDWQNKIVSSYQADNFLHHDFQLFPDRTLLLVKKSIDNQNLPKHLQIDHWLGINSDSLIELDTQQKVTWEWSFDQHLDLTSCGERECFPKLSKRKKRKTKKHRDWTHTNTVREIPDNHWFESGHTFLRPGNIITVPRNFFEVMIIDRDRKKVVWRYNKSPNNQKMSYVHDAQMIPQGFPGAGNILIFDNGSAKRGYTVIQEVNPTTSQIVWSYSDPDHFYIPSGGAIQHLANGNTFISGDNGGKVLEVNYKGEVVWRLDSNLRLNRAHKYPSRYCPQFAGLSIDATQ